MRYRLVSISSTHPGCVRERNEDSIFTDEERGIFAVADGMGGHENGDRASRQVAEALGYTGAPSRHNGVVASVHKAIKQANRDIFDDNERLQSDSGTTVVALAFDDLDYVVVWAGDSRAYRLRNGRLSQLSHDHTEVQALVDRGLIDVNTARTHDMAHFLTRAVGTDLDISLESVRERLADGDLFLLCSDGLCDVVSDREIESALNGGMLETVADDLIALCLSRGAPDNVSVVIVKAVARTRRLTPRHREGQC